VLPLGEKLLDNWRLLPLLHQIAAPEMAPREAYGLKNRSRTSWSCLLSETRTRMCRTTVPEMRDENPSGVLWQREQFCWKMRVPSS